MSTNRMVSSCWCRSSSSSSGARSRRCSSSRFEGSFAIEVGAEFLLRPARLYHAGCARQESGPRGGWPTLRSLKGVGYGKLPRRVQPDADLEAAAVVLVIVVVDAEEEPALALDGEVGALAHKEGQHGTARPPLADEGAAALVVHRQLPDQV